MSVRFILGRSGTGKTSFCIKAMLDSLLDPAGTGSLILLVPEQATYQAERAILSDERIAGYNSAAGFCGTPSKDAAGGRPVLNVLSFDRLQFLLSGKNTARPTLTRIGRQMIVHKLLRHNCDRLQIFGSSANRPGLGRQMAETISELHRYAKTADDIDRLLSTLCKDEANSLAALKFADIGLIFGEYLKSIEGEFIDPDIQLTQACAAVAHAGFIRGAKLWVDGFAGFTTSELAILAEMLKVVSEASIALCLDPSRLDLTNPDSTDPDPVSLFAPTEKTYADLIEIAKKCKLRLAEPLILKTPVRFSGCQTLAHIERNVFDDPFLAKELQHPNANISQDIRPAPRPKATDNIRIIAAPNARAEVQFVAGQILRLVREKDYRYRDIAVIASDIDGYQNYIRAYFGDHGIPFFIDKQKPLNQHPVVELICSALHAAAGGFSHSDIFAYLKTDLVPIDRGEVDMLENYCLAFGVSPDDWQSDKDWHFAGPDDEDFDEKQISQIRSKVSARLLRLRDRLCPGDSPPKTIDAAEFTRVIFDFLESLKVRKRLSRWIEQAVEAHDHTKADEHRQFYDRLVNIFDELVEVFAEQPMACEDYLAILNSAFSQLRLSFIPPTLDQVLVGSIERSRHPSLKAVFLIGTTQAQFPTPVTFDGILTDDDRIAAESADFALAPTVGRKLVERRYLAYIAFTRPSERLYVTYPLTDDKASAVPRSQFLDNLESLFADLREESVIAEQPSPQRVHCHSELVDLLCTQLGRDAPGDRWTPANDSHQTLRGRLEGLLNDICSDAQLAEIGSTVLSAIDYDNRARLDENIVQQVFGDQIRGSATELGSFAACPYQHFAGYILHLRERREFKFEPLDVGIFYHRVLDSLVKTLNSQKKDFAAAPEEELLGLLREQITKLMIEDPFISNFAPRSPHNTFIINTAAENLEDCVLAIAQMLRAGKFRPALSEIRFGQAGEGLGEWKINLADNRLLLLSGKIDRLDIAEYDNRKIAIVFDYKRKGRSYGWSDFYYGLDMQLPIYILAVRSASDSQHEAVGAFYMPVEVSPVKTATDELVRKADSFSHKAKGIFCAEFAEQLDADTKSGWSKCYNFAVTSKDGQYGYYHNSGVLKANDFENVVQFTERKIAELAEEILSGKIDVSPYRLGTDSPCGNCKYKCVCRFDWQINDYNFLQPVRKPEVLDMVGAIDG